MDSKDVLVYGFAILLILFVGSPLTLSYVTSDSMTPTLTQDDAYVLIPTSQISEGDIVTYYSESSNKFITHRVVEVAPNGYILQGDQNQQTDQETGTADGPVSDEAVSGKVLEVGDSPVVIPGGAGIARFAGDNGVVLFALSTVLILLNEYITRGITHRSETQSNLSEVKIINMFFVSALLGGVLIVSALNPGTSLTFVASEQSANIQQSIPVEQQVTRQATFDGKAAFPSYTFANAENGGVVEIEQSKNESIVTFLIGPYQSVGSYTSTVELYYYPRTLPYSIVSWLHRIHPGLAGLGTVSGGLAVPYVTALLLVVGTPPRREIIQKQLFRYRR